MLEPCPRCSHQAPRPPKFQRPEEFQFFPRALLDLLDRELNAFRREQGYKVPKPDGAADDDEAWIAEQQRIDTAEALGPEDLVRHIGARSLAGAEGPAVATRL